MRELVWTGFVTLDGAGDSPGGTEEGHPAGGWVFRTTYLEESFELKGTELAETSALMFGARSYRDFGAVWPASEDHANYRDLPKYVVSSTLADDDIVPGWGPTEILRSTDEVARLKAAEGGAIFIHGSLELARRLGEAGLIDRYNLLIFPVLLGDGKRPFPETVGSGKVLTLLDSASYANGVIKAVYRVDR